MPCQLWMKDGKLVVDSQNRPILSADCPCGECCDRLEDWVVDILSEEVSVCEPCTPDPENPLDDCGECDYTSDGGVQTTGRWHTRRVNQILSFECDNGFLIKTQPAHGENYEQDEIVTIQVCNDEVDVPFSYNDANPPHCYGSDDCWFLVKMFCPTDDQGTDRLYPVIPAPDLPDVMSNASAKCGQEYWETCFDPNPVSFVKCAVQVLAPRYFFDDYAATEGQEPDDTQVWGVVGCFCEEGGRWSFKKICGGNSGNGLVVVDAPFTVELEEKLDDQGNPVEDELGNTVMVPVCAITCEGSKGLVEEMITHYSQHTVGSKNVFRATDDPAEWETWTGEAPVYSGCFWDYQPMGTMYEYSCFHDDGEGTRRKYHHMVFFDCDCNLSEDEILWQSASFDVSDAGLYEADEDLCICDCPDLWAVIGYAKGNSFSRSYSGSGDPRDSGEGGVITHREQNDGGSGVYAIGGSACIYAAWDDGIMLWVDCNCVVHVECNSGTPAPVKFIRYIDACICVDWREIVDDNSALFGVTGKAWGSHALVQWTHSTSAASWNGPYWLYGGTVTHWSSICDRCDENSQTVSLDMVHNAFIDYNMLVVSRQIGSRYEVGHVNKDGGITNKRLQQGNYQMSGITACGVSGNFPRVLSCDDPIGSGCPQGDWLGWWIQGHVYMAYFEHGTSVQCECEPVSWDLPICQDHSWKLSIDTGFFTERDAVPGDCTRYQTDKRKYETEGTYAYQRCTTTCESWYPGTNGWSFFAVSYVLTSCGILVNTEGGPELFSNVTIPGWRGMTTSDILDKFPYYQGASITGSYPENDYAMNGMSVVETRNSRGTLLPGWEITGLHPQDVQPPRCHTANCDGKTVYSSVAQYCSLSGDHTSETCMCQTGGSSVGTETCDWDNY